MQYAILIYEREGEREARRLDPESSRHSDAAYAAYTRALVEAGILRGGEALDLSYTATTLVAGPEGRPLVQDGPYADTKEQLGGFFVIEAADLDEALRWASQCPAASTGTGKVEVRPTVRPPRT